MLGPYLFVYNNNVYYYSDFFYDNRLRVTKLPSSMPPSRKAKEITGKKKLTVGQQKLVFVSIISTNSPSLLALLLKKLTREDCRLAIFSYKLRIYKFPKATCGLSKCNWIPRAGIFICFLWLHCVIGMSMKNEVSDNFPWKIHHNKFYFCTYIISCTTLLLASIHEKNENDVLHVWQINQRFRMLMFVSQFHVHCKIGTLIHRITFDSISNANSYQMSAKTTRKLSRVFYSSLSTKDYFKDYLNKPVACINAIFIRFVVSYYGYRKK